MTKEKQNEGTQAAEGGRPLRYVNPHYTIRGVPARDLTAEEAHKYGARIAAAQAASGVLIYREAP